MTNGATELEWATVPFATDPMANALRWGTSYNFRFVSSMGPDDLTEINVDLFKPGTFNSVTVPLENDPPPPPPPPANDICLNASPVPFNTQAFTTIGATYAGPDESCGATGGDVWVNFQAPETGTLTISTCDTDYDAFLAIYTFGACPTTPNTALDCSTTGCGMGAELTLDVNAGSVYRLRIGGMSATGSGTLDFEYGTSCTGDTDGDGAVNITDLLALLADWGACTDCATDINGDGNVDITDLLAMLGAWGDCP